MRGVLETKRYWLPLAAAMIYLFVALWTGPLVGWLLLMTAFGLMLDGATAWFAKAGGTGGLRDYKQ